MTKYLLLSATLGLTVYAQVVLKWRVSSLGSLPDAWSARLDWALRFVFQPWLLSCFAAGFLAFVCWAATLREMELSHAYPFMGLSFILVSWLSFLLLGEELSPTRLFGTLLVVLGVAIASQG